jgi:ubiquinone/menaquinone biosynthesis C-methylase UbiE
MLITIIEMTINYMLENSRERISTVFKYHITSARSLLDMGCGDGTLWTRYFSNNTEIVIGIDIVLFHEWKEVNKMNIQFLRGDARFLPFRSKAFDVVFEKDVLHHVNNPERIICEMKRVAKKRIVLVEANRYHPFSFFWMVMLRGHKHFTLSQFMKLVKTVTVEVEFYKREAHFLPLPFNSKLSVISFNVLQDVSEKLLKTLANYNIACIKLNDAE